LSIRRILNWHWTHMQNFERNSQILQFKSIEFSLPGVMIVDFLKTRNVSSSYIGKSWNQILSLFVFVIVIPSVYLLLDCCCRKACSLGISEEVVFLPSISTEEKNSLLLHCFCVIYTPKDEHFGIVPIEAMSVGKPVVACNSGGPVESCRDGVTGFTCPSEPEVFNVPFKDFFLLLQSLPPFDWSSRTGICTRNESLGWWA